MLRRAQGARLSRNEASEFPKSKRPPGARDCSRAPMNEGGLTLYSAGRGHEGLWSDGPQPLRSRLPETRLLRAGRRPAEWCSGAPETRLRCRVTLLHGYANPLKRLDISESVNLRKCLILLDSCQIHATRCRSTAFGESSRARKAGPPFSIWRGCTRICCMRSS